MSRVWDGSAGFDEILVMSPGNLSGIDGGPITMCALWRPAAISVGTLMDARNSGASHVWSLLVDTNKYYIEGDFTGADTAIVNVWQIEAITKPTGSSTYRSHFFRYDTSVWAHTNRQTVGDGTGPVTEVRIGGGYDRLDGEVAAIGVWNSELSDATLEGFTTQLKAWNDTAPSALWGFNQASSSDPVNDVTGGGANQSSVIGTAPGVSANEPPGWSYALGGVANSCFMQFM